MKKIIMLLWCMPLLFGCINTNNNKSEKTKDSSEEPHTFGMNNYAVIWSTPNGELLHEHNEAIQSEFTHLWKTKKIENAYFDNESNQVTPKSFPNVVFFLKAKSKNKATALLNDLTIFKQGIASYKIFPVGTLWLGRNTEVGLQNGNKRSFVTVWETKSRNLDSETLKEQSNKILELWSKGLIENIYFDTEGTQDTNEVKDFVFFTKANSIEDVNILCNSLPFSKNNSAIYKVFEVGVFWFGPFEDKH